MGLTGPDVINTRDGGSITVGGGRIVRDNASGKPSDGSKVPALDNSSGFMQYTEPYGDTYRGFLDSFNQTDIAREDWIRGEQSAWNAFQRESSFNREENQKNRDFQSSEAEKAYQRDREARQTQYQDVMQSMQAAGLNPLLAYQNTPGSISAPAASGSSASSSGGRSSYSKHSYNDPFPALLGSLMKMVAGLVLHAGSNEFTDITTNGDGVVKSMHVRSKR